MSTSLRALGDVVRSFRTEAAITQRELASLISPPTSRSTIAHLEQGIQLPAPQTLSAICTQLGIPKSCWEPFLGRAGRRMLIQESAAVEHLPQLLAVAGVNGSGKSTLVKRVASILGYASLPEAAHGIAYLPDLAADPGRFAFEAQLAFLTHKALHLRSMLDRGARVLLDRSLEEDVDIFAAYWRDRGDISERAYATYSALARHFEEMVPASDLVVYCRCSAETAFARIQGRPQAGPIHAFEHVRDLHRRYEEWLAKYRGDVLIIDTEERDVRQARVVREIAEEIRSRFRSSPEELYQLSLFDVHQGAAQGEATTAVAGTPRPIRRDELPASPVVQRHHQPILAYLAAPFPSTASSTAEEPEAEPGPLSAHSPYGVIARGPYRSALLSIERALQKYEIDTWIPHRDTNQRGRRSMTPAQVAQESTHQVMASDLIVCLLGGSAGAHYELGLARGLGKPTILLASQDLESSFIAQGLEKGDWPDALVVQADKIQDFGELIRQPTVRDYLSRYFPILP